jgi:hypothetical protein
MQSQHGGPFLCGSLSGASVQPLKMVAFPNPHASGRKPSNYRAFASRNNAPAGSFGKSTALAPISKRVDAIEIVVFRG